MDAVSIDKSNLFSFFLRTFFLIKILCAPAILCAQAPYYLQDGTKWMYRSDESTEPGMSVIRGVLEENVIQGDTMINSIQYKILHSRRENSFYVPQFHTTNYTYNSLPQAYLRHDTLTRKMYLFSDTSTAEILIWDFDLSVGDTIPLSMGNAFGPWVIDSINSITLFGKQTNQYFLEDANFPSSWNPENYMIEGMGGSNGLTYFQPVQIVVSGGIFMNRLACFESGDSLYTTYIGGSCPFFTNINDLSEGQSNVNVFPNPFSSGFFVQTSVAYNSVPLDFCVYDISGRIVHEEKLFQGLSYIGFEKAGGFYCWKLFSEEKIIARGKILNVK